MKKKDVYMLVTTYRFNTAPGLGLRKQGKEKNLLDLKEFVISLQKPK